MGMCEPLVAELDQEVAATRTLLERVPEEKLSWKPHEKSMTLGQLALHVAGLPGVIADLAKRDEVGPPEFGNNPQPGSPSEILSALDEGMTHAKEYLSGLSDEQAMGMWKVTKDGIELMAVPRIGFLRSIMLNHWYHHRGQLTVYLRLLDVPLPAVYGASADENPFAGN